MPKLDTNALNMPGHAARTELGRLRKIRRDTLMETLEKRYDVRFPGRSDMEWGTFKDEYRVNSIREALKKRIKQ
jgi:hypothetical protein